MPPGSARGSAARASCRGSATSIRCLLFSELCVANRSWLASIGNGALGEARVKALLLNRFWVSTRSVDVNGADFLVELPSEQRFTDLMSPPIGTVQAKFCKNDATSHYIPIEYAVDEQGAPLEGFFVVVTVGHEDAAEEYVLTAQEVSTLPKGTGKSRGKFYLSSDAWKQAGARTSSQILDVIESALKRRSAQQTERFLQSINIPDFTFTRTGLDPEWLLPIPNEFAFIPDAVYRIRTAVRADIYSFDDVMAAMQRVVNSPDVAIVSQGLRDVAGDQDMFLEDGICYLRRQLIADYSSSHHNLKNAVQAHRKRLKFLQENNLLDKFMQASEMIRGEHERFYDIHSSPVPVGGGATGYRAPTHFAETEVTFDPQNFAVVAVKCQLSQTSPQPQVESTKFTMGRSLYLYFQDYGPPSVWRELHGLQIELLSVYYGILNPDDSVLAPKRPTHLDP